jgi:hypothetical protein
MIGSVLWFVVARAFGAIAITDAMLDAQDEMIRNGGKLP